MYVTIYLVANEFEILFGGKVCCVMWGVMLLIIPCAKMYNLIRLTIPFMPIICSVCIVKNYVFFGLVTATQSVVCIDVWKTLLCL